MGVRFAFSGKTAQAKYEGHAPPEVIHVAIDEKSFDQKTVVRKIAEVAQDRHALFNLDSHLWYIADVNNFQPGRDNNAKRFVISITQWELLPCDVRYIESLPYASPLFLLLSRLEVLTSSTKRSPNKISKLLTMVQSWHTAVGETITLSAFSRFPRSLDNARELCKQCPSLGDSFLRMGINVAATPLSVPEMQEHEVEAAHLEVAVEAAYSTVAVLRNLGVPCALFGGMACYLYGNTRVPKDVDVLAFPPWRSEDSSAEELKLSITQRDPTRFFLREAREASSPYKILWYRRPLGVHCYSLVNECKIDIVLPGILHLPNIRPEQLRVDERYHLPVIPFSLLLLHKLKAWDDRVNARESYKRARQATDSSDVQALLRLPHVVSLRFSRPWNDEILFNKEFQAQSRERVRLFCLEFPSQTQDWRMLGFEVSSVFGGSFLYY
jgi:hypothetical protein